MKLNEIQDLIKFVAKSGVSEVEIESEGFKLTIKTPPNKRGSRNTAVDPQALIQTQVPVATPVQQIQPVVSPQVQAAPAPAPAPVADSNESKSAKEADDSKYVEIKSPMIGTFYRRPSPDKPNFVEVGDEVTEGKTVCIIEAMKLFNEIESEISGKIVKTLVEDNTPVEYDQPLFLVDPS